jgi:8-amino-7-oxononanoate synthase
MSLAQRWRLHLEELRRQDRYRVLQAPAGHDFSSNDYLGYSKRGQSPSASEGPILLLAGARALTLEGRSGTASRLLRGQHPIWEEVESRLARWHQAEAALIMTSGYAANEGLLSTIIEPGDLAFSDQYNHASLIDGLRLGRAEKIIYRHNDLDELERLLRQRHSGRLARHAWFIVTESLFGMEGDVAPLRELAELADRYQAHLIVDEAHATGCFGAKGSGLVDALSLRERVLATVHTGGKALAVPGAYIVGSQLLKELLVNRCRHFIFTTALPPQIGQWWLETLETAVADEAARTRLHERAEYIRGELIARNITVGGTHYIVSLVLGADAAAVAVSRQLQERGFDIRAIRPPTVPAGMARLRISIHADHDLTLLRELAELLADLRA